MNAPHRIRTAFCVGLGSAAILLAGCSTMTSSQSGNTVGVALSGSEEVPPVATAAWGYGIVTIGSDLSVTGKITVAGLAPVAAHIHLGKRGANGPVIVGLANMGDNVWAVPAGAALTLDQFLAFKSGDLYVNFHTPANKGGEVRAQLQP